MLPAPLPDINIDFNCVQMWEVHTHYSLLPVEIEDVRKTNFGNFRIKYDYFHSC